MSKRQVVITGLGLITSLGEEHDQVWQALCEGKSGVKLISRWDPSIFSSHIGAECTDFDVTQYGVEARDARRLDRFGQFGLAASVQAVKDAGIDFEVTDRKRCGVIIGSGIGGIETLQEQHNTMLAGGLRRVSPFTVPRLMVNAASGNVSIRFGLQGPNTAVATACATGSNSIGDAARLIEAGYADVMIGGGSEAALCMLGVGSFAAARALSTRNDEPTKASRPWDKDRDGFVMGEGAGVVVLEELEHAKKRGARIYAEVIGYAMNADAHHITAPLEDGSGASRCMDMALKDAGISPEAVDYINAHGTSTSLGDIAETKAIKKTFGDAARTVAISSTKSHLGHLLGASGGIEAIFATLAIHHNIAPPTINLDNPDPECDLDYIPHKPREMKIDVSMSNSFGFGGHNATLLLRRFG